MISSRLCLLLAAVMVLVNPVRSAWADTISVAVASNFAEAMGTLSGAFERESGHRLRISFGSTGKFYAQIANGAPFQVFLAADQARPARLESEGLAIPATRFTYAEGRLVLWSPDGVSLKDPREALGQGGFRHLSIANPDLAPYGEAAQQTLRSLEVWDRIKPKLVRGQNIGQAFQLVATGNAELGFVALSQVKSPRNARPGTHWVVPGTLHAPIRQDAVLLKDDPAARTLLDFLKSDMALRVIRSFGYGVPAD